MTDKVETKQQQGAEGGSRISATASKNKETENDGVVHPTASAKRSRQKIVVVDEDEDEDDGEAEEAVVSSASKITLMGNIVSKPGKHDVLLGRGGGTNNHSGNITFRKLVAEHKVRYLAASKVDKPKVAREVVAIWQKLNPPGRFLARPDDSKSGLGPTCEGENYWFEVDEKKAREKASQCLRERTPEMAPYWKKLQTEEKKTPPEQKSEQQRPTKMKGASMPQQQMNHMKMQMPMQMKSQLGMVPAEMAMNSMGMNQMQMQMQMQMNAMNMNMSMNGMGPMHMNNMNGMNPMPMNSMNGMTMMNQPGHVRRQSLPAGSAHSNNNDGAGHHNRRISMPAGGVAPTANSMQMPTPSSMPNMMMHPNMVGSGMNMGMSQQSMSEHQLMMQQQYGANVGSPMMRPQHMSMGVHSPQGVASMNMHMHHPMSPMAMNSNNMAMSMHQINMQQQQHIQRQLQQVEEKMMSLQKIQNQSPSPQNVPSSDTNDQPQQQQSQSAQQQQPESNAGDTKPNPYTYNFDDDDDDDMFVPLKEPAPSKKDRPDTIQSGERKSIPESQEAASSQKATKRKQDEKLTNDRKEDLNMQPPEVGRPKRNPSGDSELTLNEYRKTLENYITNHQMNNANADVLDDEYSDDEDLGLIGVDASEWIQQALNDSQENMEGSGPVGRQRQRRGSRMSVRSGHGSAMSIATNDTMSLAFSDMAESLKEIEKESGLMESRSSMMSRARRQGSNQSVMSELTDFSGIE
jgi:hypothetical protein